MSTRAVRLRLLGRMQYDGEAVEMPRKARALLAYVAVHRSPLQRAQLAELLCSETVDPRRTLRTLLSHVRRAAPALLDVQEERVSVGDHRWIDCHVFSRAVEEGTISGETLNLYRGAFMAG